MKKIGHLFFACTGLVVLLAAGCATAPTRLAKAYGTSHTIAKSNQILHPEAENNLEPVEGLDGKAAQHTIERYRSTFKKPPPPPAFSISIGGMK